MSPAELQWLALQAKTRPFIVEFGSWVGRSTRALADQAATVWACDHWRGDNHSNGIHNRMIAGGLDVEREFLSNLHEEIAIGAVVPVTVDLRGEWALSKIRDAMRGQLADMVFIDANHVAPHPLEDIKLARKLVGPGAIIAGHDYDPRGWPDVVEAAHKSFSRVHRGPGSIWWASVRNYTGE